VGACGEAQAGDGVLPELGQRHRKIERRAFFANVGRREMNGHALTMRKLEAAIAQCADLMRSRLSLTALSGRPTTLKSCMRAEPTSTSTSTG